MTLMNKSAWKSLMLVLALLVSFASGACRVRQTEEGNMPDVDVKTEGGKLPEYDVDAADVDVKTEKREIEVPVVEVEPPRDGDQDAPLPRETGGRVGEVAGVGQLAAEIERAHEGEDLFERSALGRLHLPRRLRTRSGGQEELGALAVQARGRQEKDLSRVDFRARSFPHIQEKLTPRT